MKRVLVAALVFVFSVSFVSATLGISPAKIELDFSPNDKHVIDYLVISDKPNTEIEIYAEGDLAEYVKFNKEKITGQDVFKAILELPSELEKPGEHKLLIGAREIPGEDQFIGTSINIRGLIVVDVPFPGRYAEATLNVADGNVDEQIPVEARVVNKGKENISVNVNVQFFTESGEMIFNMPFKPAVLEPTKDRFFRKFLDTTGYKPGDYRAEAFIDFGELIKAEDDFRVGSLFVRINNFTEKLPQGGIQKFFVEIESRWNADLKEVFADVNISNGVQEEIFRTPSVDLRAWEKKTLEGFLDTSELEGRYETNIILSYAGQENSASGILTITKINPALIIAGVAIAAVLLILIAAFILYRIRKNKKSKKKRRESRKRRTTLKL